MQYAKSTNHKIANWKTKIYFRFRVNLNSYVNFNLIFKKFYLFLIVLMLKWAKTNLFKLSLLTDFQVLTQSFDFSLSKDDPELSFSVQIPGLFWLFCQLTILHISLVNILPNIRELFSFRCNLFLLRYWSFVLFGLSIK